MQKVILYKQWKWIPHPYLIQQCGAGFWTKEISTWTIQGDILHLPCWLSSLTYVTFNTSTNYFGVVKNNLWMKNNFLGTYSMYTYISLPLVYLFKSNGSCYQMGSQSVHCQQLFRTDPVHIWVLFTRFSTASPNGSKKRKERFQLYFHFGSAQHDCRPIADRSRHSW